MTTDPSNNASSSKHPDRVVIFHDFSQALGGASFLVQVLIAQLAKRNIPITFIAGDDGANFSRDDVEFIPLGGKALLDRSKLGALTKGLHYRKAYAITRDWIAQNDTPNTIYHVHGWCKILTPAILGALRPVSDRLVLHGHDYFNTCPNGAFFNYVTEQDCKLQPMSAQCLASQCDKSSYAEKLWRSARETSRRALMGGGTRANRLLMIHPGQRANFELGGWPAEQLKSVRNPVEAPVSERIEAENNQGVIFIGRISTEKGADLVAQAAKQAGVPLTFVGDGAEMDRVSQIYPEAVLLGRQDRKGVATALSKARLAVMPSRWSEPFGLVALEAIGSGVPVIVSERALVAQEIEEAGFGLAIDTNDIDLFAETISRLSQDNSKVETMSRAGQSRYRELCNSEETWADLVIENYTEMLGENQG